MTNETLRMQMLSGIITEGQYKAKLQENFFMNLIKKIRNKEEPEEVEVTKQKHEFDDLTDEQALALYNEYGKAAASIDQNDPMVGGYAQAYSNSAQELKKRYPNAIKESLNESMIGGIVGIGAINQIPSRAKADYEMAFEHFLGEKYELKPNKGRADIIDVNENMLSVNDSVRITAPLDVSAETDEGMITQVYPNFNSIPLKDIGYYEVDKEAYDESALNGPWYKVDLDGEDMLYAAEGLEKLLP